MKKRLLTIILLFALLCTILLVPAFADTTVYITDTGEKYHCSGCKYLRSSCHAISLSDAVNNGYTACSVCHAPTSASANNTSSMATGRFVDVPNDKYYYEPVSWAYHHDPQITLGTDADHFAPNSTCTRGQIVTFLWRANGCPQPEKTNCQFVDVKSGSYCYEAVLWAVENNITNGFDATHFSPNEGCTRSQVVTFLWRADGQPGPASSSCSFKDVKASMFYYSAVLWAVEEGITLGVTDTTFEPDTTCTRGQIVTFLYRDMVLE